MTEQEFIHRVIHKPWANRCESFDKMDCIGLVNLYYKNVLGLPCVKIDGYGTNEDIGHLYNQNIKRYWVETDVKQGGVMVVMESPNEPPHLGILLSCKTKVLHCNGSVGREGKVSIHSLSSLEWFFKLSFHRLVQWQN